MKNRHRWGIALWLILLAATGWADADSGLTPQHFAWQATLSAGQNSLREVILPQHVWQHLQRADGGDLRVFNAAGQVVPHRLQHTGAEVSDTAMHLVFYPFTQQQAADTAKVRIQIMQQQESGSIQIQSKLQPAKRSATAHAEYQYIIENADTRAPLCALQANWQQEAKSLVMPLKLESSDDLTHWHSLLSSATLSRLNYNGAELVESGIHFPCTRHRYLRLTWLQPEQSVHLQTLTGLYRHSKQAPEQTLNLGKPVVKNARWFFQLPAALPVSGFALRAPQDGLLYKGKLYSRAGKKDPWQPRSEFIQYRIRLGDNTVQSAPIRWQGQGQVQWQARLPGLSYRHEQLPDIVVHYQPRKLVFLAQGKGPFTLAYGNAEVPAMQDNGVLQLLDELGQKQSVEQVSTATAHKNATVRPLAAKPVPDKPFPWELLAFWGLLLLGTAVLGYMAYRLYRQMNAGEAGGK